jgi:hypothetical protein
MFLSAIRKTDWKAGGPPDEFAETGIEDSVDRLNADRHDLQIGRRAWPCGVLDHRRPEIRGAFSRFPETPFFDALLPFVKLDFGTTPEY